MLDSGAVADMAPPTYETYMKGVQSETKEFSAVGGTTSMDARGNYQLPTRRGDGTDGELPLNDVWIGKHLEELLVSGPKLMRKGYTLVLRLDGPYITRAHVPDVPEEEKDALFRPGGLSDKVLTSLY